MTFFISIFLLSNYIFKRVVIRIFDYVINIINALLLIIHI